MLWLRQASSCFSRSLPVRFYCPPVAAEWMTFILILFFYTPLCESHSCWPVNILSVCWRNVPLADVLNSPMNEPCPVCVYVPTPIRLCSSSPSRLELISHLLLFPTRGFSVNTAGRSHVFKPVSVQAMWWVNPSCLPGFADEITG